MIKGDLLMESKVAAKGAGRGLAAVIPAGMRAVTIQTPNVATGVAGFILPGNKVDILLTMTNQGSDDRTGGGSTITLLQNVEILAVDQQVDVPQANKIDTKELRSVTLLVTPAEASRLDLGQNKGTLRLTLRNPIDKSIDDVDLVTLKSLNVNSNETGTERRDPAPVAEAPPLRTKVFTPVVRTLRGTRTGYIKFQAIDNESAGRDALPATVSDMTNSLMVPGPVPDPVR
jgi:pilus assembly protein CpaB